MLYRKPSGEIVAWPVVETVQLGGVCSEVIAPAPHSGGRLADVAAEIAITIAEGAEPPLPLISHRVTGAGVELYDSPG